jgi:hypothetical protein
MFRQDLEVIDNLRRDAINVREPHISGIKRLQTYAGQLAWMGGKFPIDVNNRHFYPFLSPNLFAPGRPLRGIGFFDFGYSHVINLCKTETDHGPVVLDGYRSAPTSHGTQR